MGAEVPRISPPGTKSASLNSATKLKEPLLPPILIYLHINTMASSSNIDALPYYDKQVEIPGKLNRPPSKVFSK